MRQALKVMTLVGTRTQVQFGPGYSSFAQILQIHASTEATNPLDKIYAFLGLAPMYPEVQSIPIDYKLPVADLFRHLVKAHLEHRKDTSILNHCCGVVRPQGYSSWISPPM
jgi:hypothetical protein